MRRSQILIALVTVAISVLFSTTVSAQSAQLRGHVVIQQPDGTKVPAAGAVIDIYRTDVGGKYSLKADSKGNWIHAGVPLVGTYVVAASAPNASPNIKTGVKAGRDLDYEIVLTPGDGRRYTEEEAKGAGSGNSVSNTVNTSGESAADKAKREEAIKKYEAEKSRVTNINETLNRTVKAGDAAMAAKNYEEAIKQYEEGLAADPEQIVFYARKSTALRSRGVEHYNTSVKAADATVKATELEGAKKDFRDAADAATKGVEVAKKEQAATEPSELASQNARKLEILGNRAESMRLYAKVDQSQGGAAVTAYEEYIAAEPDPVKKAKAEKDSAQVLFDTANSSSDVGAAYQRAVAAYKKILEANPDDTDAILRIGQSLFNIGALSNDKATYQEAANYLQQFVSKAPDTNPLKAEAKDLIEALKATANVTPEKINTPPRRRRP
jgi:tetratricopeptide (TPR) repeat protein